ncbi:MAG TPA: AsmA family protein [bacterium]|nr:AsmA family protein [bacterium]
MARSPSRLRWLLIGGTVLVLVVVAVAAPVLIPVDRYRPLLQQFIRTSLGREVQIGGLRLYLLPTIHIHVANVRLKNPPGFPRDDAIFVKSIDLGVAGRGLLARRLDVTYIALSGVRVEVLSDPAGRSNFDLPAPPRGDQARKPAAGTRRAPLVALNHIGVVTGRDVGIAFASVDPRGGPAPPYLAFDGLNVKIRSVDLTASNWAAKLQVAIALRGARLVTSSLTKPVQFQTGELLVKGGGGRGGFAASLDSMRFTGTAAITSFVPFSSGFTLAVPRLDIDRLERVLAGGGGGGSDLKAPPPRPRLVARVEVTADRLVAAPVEATRARGWLNFYTTSMQLDSFSLTAYGGAARGAAALNYASADLPATAMVHVRGMNLGEVVRIFNPGKTQVSGGLDADLSLRTALGRDPKAALTGTGTFVVHRLAAAPLEANEVRGRVRLRANRIQLTSYTLSAYGGTIRGAGGLDYSGRTLPAAGTAMVHGINLEQVVSAVAPGTKKVTGTLDANLSLATALGQDPEAALTGGGTFAVRNGSFPGLDLKHNLAQIARVLQLNVPAGDTRFSYFGGDVRFAQQRVYSNSLRLVGDGLEGTGRGSFGFNATLDYTGTGVLTLSSAGTSPTMGVLPSAGEMLGRVLPGAAGSTGARVPFSIRGTFGDPKFALVGMPEFARAQGIPPQQIQQPQLQLPPALQDLFKAPR